MTDPRPESPTPRKRRWWKIPLYLFGGVLAIAFLIFIGIKILGAMGFPINMYGNFTPDFNFETREEQYERLEADRLKTEAASAESQASFAALKNKPQWPGYRGVDRTGHSPETGLLAPWPEDGPPMLYRQPVGAGWSGFVIGLERAYTIEQRRENEAVTCYDLMTGVELWAHTYPAIFEESMGGDGPRSTPALDGDRLYALGAQGDLHCLDALSGEVVWHANILEDFGAQENLFYGTTASPLIVDDLVWVTSSGKGGPGLLAFNKVTGEVALEGLDDVKQAYSSLALETVAGQPMLINLAGKAIHGIDPETGEILWQFPWSTQSDINPSQPIVVDENRVFLSSGYGTGASLLSVTKTDGNFIVNEAWHSNEMRNKFSSSILVGDHIYGLNEGILACIDVETGKRAWKKGRLGHGQMLFAEGNLIVLAEDGDLYLIEATPEAYKEISRTEALEGKTWNHLALAGGILVVRNDRQMAAFDLRD